MSEENVVNRSAIITGRQISKRFTGVEALSAIDLDVYPGEVLCLLGDNGAGKSSLIKVLSGVHPPSAGSIAVDDKPVTFSSPRDARLLGIATVHQYGGTVPLMSIGRNFFLGAEPTKGVGSFRRIDIRAANEVALRELRGLGLTRIRDGEQFVGSLSGGERQCLAIARAMYFGARVLILDEPTAALGVKEASIVLRLISHARDRGVAVILVTHNATHALSVGDRFLVLIHGAAAASWRRGEKTREEVLSLMAGGEEMEELELELAHQPGAHGVGD